MPTKREPRAGLTLLEILVVVALFSMGMLPVLSLIISTNKGSYSMTRHLFAGQLAGSIADKLLAMPFEECRKTIREMKATQKIVDSPEFSEAVQNAVLAGSAPTFGSDLQRIFRNFDYDVVLQEPSSRDEAEQYFSFVVSVYWQVDDNNSSFGKQRYTISSMKFREY